LRSGSVSLRYGNGQYQVEQQGEFCWVTFGLSPASGPACFALTKPLVSHRVGAV
jgi:hypothetical protein